MRLVFMKLACIDTSISIYKSTLALLHVQLKGSDIGIVGVLGNEVAIAFFVSFVPLSFIVLLFSIKDSIAMLFIIEPLSIIVSFPTIVVIRSLTLF